MPKTKSNGEGHNSAAREGALHNHMQAFHDHLDQIDEAKAGLASLKQRYTLSRNAAKADGFTLKILDEAIKLERKRDRAEQERQEAERSFVFESRGLPFGLRQADLFGEGKETEQAKKHEAFWAKDGYSAGILNLEATPPAECPQEFYQVWLERRAAGVERVKWTAAESTNVEQVQDPLTE